MSIPRERGAGIKVIFQKILLLKRSLCIKMLKPNLIIYRITINWEILKVRLDSRERVRVSKILLKS